MKQLEPKWYRFFLLFCTYSLLSAHEIPTHRNLTEAAFRFLLQRDPRLQCANQLLAALQVGTEKEDDPPRSMFHFTPRLNGVVPLVVQYQVAADCDSLQWAFGVRPCSQSGFPGQPTPLNNVHTWQAAVAGATSNQGPEHLGYVVHLLEDLGSPAHTRNDPHPALLGMIDADPFETANNGVPVRMPRPAAPLFSFSNPYQPFADLQAIVQSGYYSNNTVGAPDIPSGPAISQLPDNDYFRDGTGRKIAYKGSRYRLTGNIRDASINRTIAREQFAELGPVIVLWVASFLEYYVQTAHPQLSGCPANLFI